MKTRNGAVMVAGLAALATACTNVPEQECYERPIEQDGPWILSDHYHARKQNQEDYVLDKNTYSYQGIFGFRRVFDHLDTNGYDWTSIREMGLSAERLHGFDTLFINLLSADRPDFTDDEVQAIIEFVEDGGGLFVIADHTNVYNHAERVNKFLIPMGIEVLYHLAVDFPPEHSVAGLGWIMVRDFAEHPVTDGLEMITLQTGGPMEGGGVAFSSDQSFGDLWDPEDDGGYYGNWTFDGDEEVEPRGPLEVYSAVEYGEGRVVVAGDQNMFGDAFAHWANNWEVFMNSVEWVSQQDDVGGTRLRDTRPFGTLIAFEQEHSNFIAGRPGAAGWFSFFVNLNRDRQTTARGSIALENEEDVLVLASVVKEYTEGELEAVREYLSAGKSVMITFDPAELDPATGLLLAELAPQFTMDASGTDFDVTTFTTANPDKLTGHGTILSNDMALEGDLGIYDIDPATVSEDAEQPEPYLWDVTSEWGEPFVQAEVDGTRVDIIRRAEVGGGELLIMMQDGLWRNRSLGEYLRAPTEYNRGNHDLQFALVDYWEVPEADIPDVVQDEDPPARTCR